ncbi:hypothetical protein [Novipirellula aureliae]|uniref:hypothetical protein n=1 Tax=Novipirellula aureliae TaxID=2527966 RepID=UPI0011B4FE29|nr:hypothetical protein [Novipirellula aureliae]
MGKKEVAEVFLGAWQSRYPLPLLLDSLDASEQETPPIEHHLDDRERCFAETTAATVCDLGLFFRPLCSVPTTGRFVNIIDHFSTDVRLPSIPVAHAQWQGCFGLRPSSAEEHLP